MTRLAFFWPRRWSRVQEFPRTRAFQSSAGFLGILEPFVHECFGAYPQRGLFRAWLIGSHLRTPALKTENFSKKMGRFSKTQKWIY